MSNIWIFRTNNGSNHQIFISIIHMIRPMLADIGSKHFQWSKKMMTSVRALLKYFVVPVTENPRFLRHYLRNEGRVRKFCYCLKFENSWDFTNRVQSKIIAPSLLKLFWIGVVSKLSDILVIEELTNYVAFFSFRTFRYIDEMETETKAQNLPWRKEFAVIT